MQTNGKLIIPLTPGGEAGWCYYSSPVALKPEEGDLWIDAALENSDGSRVFGSAGPFEEADFCEEPIQAEIGALVAADHASFRIGLKLLKDTDQTQAVVYWRASRLPVQTYDPKPDNTQDTKKWDPNILPAQSDFYIEATPAYLHYGDRFMFTCHRPEGITAPVEWKVKGENAGSINGYGMYIAPDRAGVFEIEATCLDFSATCYLMVREEKA